MKIQTQFRLLIAAIIIIPLLCMISVPVHYYLTSSQRYLMQGYKQIREIGELDVSDNDWDELEEQLEGIPPNVQVAVVYDSSVIISTIEDLPVGTAVDVLSLFTLMHDTAGSYDYQLQSPLHKRRPTPDDESTEARVASQTNRFLVISRTKIPDAKGPFDKKKTNAYRVYIPFFVGVLAFIIFCIIYLIRLSRTISSSITILEKNTQKIAAGELNSSIENKKTSGYSNEITSLTRSIEKMRQSLKEDQEKQSRFIMGISHDLRTPVALIKGYTEAITDGVVGDMDSVKKSLDVIHTKADQLEGMINELINYVKLNNTDWRETLREEELLPLLEEFAQGATLTGEVYKRTIVTELNVDGKTKVQMDKALFQRALENLFSNAVRYSKEGDTIEIKALQSDDDIRISVRDTGAGIAEQELEHVWELFYRGTNSRREQGMGIGLSTVKNIIDTHGWNISVSSELGKGSTFTITIPRQAS